MPKKSRTLFYHQGILHRFNYDKALENKLFSYNSNNSKEIKGTVASVGKVRGKAVIIKDYNDLDKEYNNCILVSVMTSPDITPAIKKAKAIITDEGGITCHAAIISRELNIPCIIGTKNATKVLRDGDLVEVDANRGIVKILKRAK
jgi:pyruvate,water dikinase